MEDDLAMRPHHYWKFRSALCAICAGEAPLRERLCAAMSSCLVVRSDELPTPVREIYLELEAQTTWKQDGDEREGTLGNTFNAMSDADAKKVAALFVDLFEATLGVAPPVEV